MTGRTESYSSLKDLAACAEMYRLSRVERLEAPGINLPQHNGRAMAAGLKELYGKGFNPGALPVAQDALRAEWGDVTPPLGSKKAWLTRDFAERRLALFVEEREKDPTIMETSAVLAGFAEEERVFEWADAEGRLVTLRTIPDLIIRDGAGRVIVTDTKCPTSSWIGDHYWLRFSLGHQLRLYAAMFEQTQGEVCGVGLINAIYCGEKALDAPEAWKKRKSVPSALREFSFTPHQIAETWRWAYGLTQQRDHHAALGFWPRNEGACDAYGGCQFRDLCMAPSEMAWKARAMSNFRKKEAK